MGAGTAGEDDELRTFEDLQPVSYAWEQMVGSKEEQDESQLLDRLNTLKEIYDTFRDRSSGKKKVDDEPPPEEDQSTEKKSLLEKVREWALYAEPRQPTFLLIIPTDNAVFQFLVWAYRTITGTEEDGGEEEDDEDAPSDLLPGMKHSLVATWAKMLDLVLKNRTTWLWLLDFTSDIIATIQLYNRNSAGAQFIIQAAIVILNTRIYAMIFAMTGEMRFPVLGNVAQFSIEDIVAPFRMVNFRHLSTLWLPPPVSSLAIGSGALPFQFNLYHVTSGPSSWDKYRDPFKFPNIMVYIKMWWQYLRSKGQFGLYSAIMKVIVFFCFPLVPFLWLIELGYAIFIAGVYRVFGFLLLVIGFLLWRPYLATVRRFASFFQLGVMVQEYQGDPIHVTADKPIMISQGSDITDTMPDRGEGAGRIEKFFGLSSEALATTARKGLPEVYPFLKDQERWDMKRGILEDHTLPAIVREFRPELGQTASTPASAIWAKHIAGAFHRREDGSVKVRAISLLPFWFGVWLGCTITVGAVYELMIWLGVIITPVKLVDAVVKTGVDSARHFVDWFSGRQPTIDELQHSAKTKATLQWIDMVETYTESVVSLVNIAVAIVVDGGNTFLIVSLAISAFKLYKSIMENISDMRESELIREVARRGIMECFARPEFYAVATWEDFRSIAGRLHDLGFKAIQERAEVSTDNPRAKFKVSIHPVLGSRSNLANKANTMMARLLEDNASKIRREMAELLDYEFKRRNDLVGEEILGSLLTMEHGEIRWSKWRVLVPLSNIGEGAKVEARRFFEGELRAVMSHVRVLRKERDLRKLDVDAAIQNATEKKDKEELTKAKGRVAKKKKKEDREDAKDDIRSQQLFLYSPIESELSPVLWATVHKSTGASQHQRLRLAMREDIAEDRKEERKRRREERKDGVDPQQQQQPGPKKKQPRAGEGEVTGEAAAAETMEVGGVQGACLGKTKTMEIPAPRLDDAIVRALAQRLWEVRRVEGGWFLRFRFRWPRVFESLEECEQYARVLLGHLTVRMARPALNEDEKKERARYRDLVLAAFNAEVDENEGKSFFEVLQREAQMESLKAALGWGDDVEEDDIEDYEAADASRWLPFQVDVDATVLYRMVWELLGEVDATLVELESPGKGKKEDRLKGLVDVVLKGDRKKDAEPADEDAARRERTLRGWVEDDVARAIVSCVRHVMEDHVGRMGADDRADLNRALAKELEARMRADRDYEDEFTKKFPWRPLDAVERLEHNDKMARGMDSVDAVLPDKGKPGVDALLATWGGRSSDVFAAVFEEVPLTVDTRTEIVAQHVLEEIEEECERLAGKYHDLEQGLCRRVSSRVKGAFRALTCRGTGAEKAVFEKNLLKTIQVRLKVSLVTDCTVCGLGVNCGKSNHGVTFRVTIDRAHLKKELMGIRVTYKSLWDSLSKAEKEAALKGTPAKPATPSAGADPKAPPKGAAGPVAESLDKDSSTEIEEVFITADPALDRMRAREDEGGAPTGPQNNVGDRIDLGHSKMKTEAVGDVTWALDLAEKVLMRLIKEGIDAKAAAAKDAAAQKEADGGKPGKVAKSTISKSLVLDMVEHAIREEVILRLKLKARQDWRREEINARQLHEILRGCVPLAWACAPHREAINAWTVSSLLKEQKEIERRRAFLTFLMNEEKKLERGDASSDPEAESWHVPTGLLSTNGALCRMPMWKEDKKEGKERQALRQDELAVLTELFRTPFGIVCPTFAHRTLIHMQRSVMEAYRFGDVTFSERIEELQTQFGTAVVEYEKEETFVDGVQAFIRAFGQSNARDADMHFRVRLTMTQKPRLPEGENLLHKANLPVQLYEELLLNPQLEVDHRDDDGETPLSDHAFRACKRIRGGDNLEQDGSQELTPLFGTYVTDAGLALRAITLILTCPTLEDGKRWTPEEKAKRDPKQRWEDDLIKEFRVRPNDSFFKATGRRLGYLKFKLERFVFATIELFEDLATGMTWRWERYVLGEDSEPEEKRPEPDTLDNCKFLIQNFMSTYAKPGSSDGLKFQAQGEVLLVNIMLIMRAAHAAATGYDRGSGKVSGEPVPESEKKAFKEVFRWRFQYLLRKAYKTYRIVALQGGVITYFARTYLSVLGASSPEVSLGQARSSIELFLLLGANPNSADRDGLTPLHKACMLPTDDAVDVIRTLIAYGADVNMRSRRGRKTPLMCACEFLTPWSVAVVKLLLESGADPSMADSKGNTPLHSLACIGYTFTTLTVADQGQTLPDPRRVFVPEPDKTVKSAKDWKSKLKVKNLALEDAMKEGKNVKTIYPFWIKKAFVEDLLRRLEIKAVELQNQGVEGAGGADEALEIVRGELGGLSFLAFYGDQMDQDDGNMGGGGRADERLWARDKDVFGTNMWGLPPHGRDVSDRFMERKAVSWKEKQRVRADAKQKLNRILFSAISEAQWAGGKNANAVLVPLGRPNLERAVYIAEMLLTGSTGSFKFKPVAPEKKNSNGDTALDLAKAARQYLQAVANRIYFGTNLYKETPAWMCDTKNDRYLGILTGTTVRRGKPTLRDVHAAPSNLPMIRLLTVAATIRKPSRQDFLDDFVLSKFKMDTRLHHNYVRELMVTSLDPRTFNEDKKDTIKAEMEELLSTKYAVTRSVSPTMGWDYIYGTGRDLMVAMVLEWLEKERKDVKSLEHEKEKEPVLSLEKAWMHYHAEKGVPEGKMMIDGMVNTLTRNELTDKRIFEFEDEGKDEQTSVISILKAFIAEMFLMVVSKIASIFCCRSSGKKKSGGALQFLQWDPRDDFLREGVRGEENANEIMGHLGQLPTIHPSHSLKYSSAIVAGALMDTVKESDEASKTHHPLPIEWRCDFIDPERMLQKRGWYLPEDLRVGGVGLQLTVEDKLRGLAKASWEYYGDLYRAAYGTTARTTKLLAQEEKRWDILKEGVKISSWRAGKSQRSLRNMSQGQMEAAVRDEAKGNKKKGRKAEEEDPLEARENQV